MKTKILIFLSFFFVATSTVLSQDIKIKKNEILLDNNSFLKYEKITLAEYSIKDLSENEILFFQTKEDPITGATFLVFYFSELKTKIESTNVARISGFGYKNMLEKMITWLVKDKVFNTDGSINPEKLEVFKEKYNDYK